MRSRGNMLRVALLSNSSGHWTFTTITKLFVLLSPLLLGPCEREFSRNRWSQSISSASRYGWGRDYKSLWIRNKHWWGSQAVSEQRCLAEQRLEGMAATFFGEKPAGSILRNAEKEAGRQRERDMSFPSWFSKNLPINVCSESDSTKFRQNLPSYPFRWLPAFRSNFLELQSPAKAVNIFRVPERGLGIRGFCTSFQFQATEVQNADGAFYYFPDVGTTPTLQFPSLLLSTTTEVTGFTSLSTFSLVWLLLSSQFYFSNNSEDSVHVGASFSLRFSTDVQNQDGA